MPEHSSLFTLVQHYLLAFSACFAMVLVTACSDGGTTLPSMTQYDSAPLPIDAECQARVDQEGFELGSLLTPTTYDPATDTTTNTSVTTIVPCNGVLDRDNSFNSFVLNAGEDTLKGVLVTVDSSATPTVFRLFAFLEESNITSSALPVRELLRVRDMVSTVYVEIPATQARELQVAIVGYGISPEPRFGFDVTSYDFTFINPGIEQPLAAERIYSATTRAEDPYPATLAIEPDADEDNEATTFAFGTFGGGGNIAFYAFDQATGNVVDFSCGDSDQDLEFFQLAAGREGIGFTCQFEDTAIEPKSLLYLIMNNYHADPTGAMLTIFTKVRQDE